MNLTKEIESRIEKFVAELNDLVRKQAVDAVAAALGTGGSGAARRAPGRPAKASNGEARVAAPRARARKKGEKRTQAELAQLESALDDYVRNNPGQGIEAIGQALGFRTGELARPMKKLIAKGSVTTQGEKRATKYFPGDGSPAGSAEGAAKAPRAAKRGRAKKKSKKK